jgi:hypothetical protein
VDIIKTLKDFLEVAQRNRKYPMNSVYGYRAALKLFDEEISPDERESFNLFNERFEQIYSNVLNKHKNDFSIASLEIYKKRIKKILADYQKYGIDPSKMSSWSPTVIKRTVIKQKNQQNSSLEEFSDEQPLQIPAENSKHEYSLRQLKKILISYPSDFTLEEAKSIKSFADYLISMRGGDQT